MENKLIKNLLLVIEIVAVLAIMSAAKWIADSFQIIGAGSIAIWVGIIIAIFFMKRRGLNLFHCASEAIARGHGARRPTAPFVGGGRCRGGGQ